MNKCWRTWRGIKPGPPDHRSDKHLTEPETGQPRSDGCHIAVVSVPNLCITTLSYEPPVLILDHSSVIFTLNFGTNRPEQTV